MKDRNKSVLRVFIPAEAKARVHFATFAVRLKPCPIKTSTYSELPWKIFAGVDTVI
jgi:hypothetical protein